MWNEMVIDEEITFNREESAHTGKVLHPQNCSILNAETCGEQNNKSHLLVLFLQRIAQIVLELRKRMKPMTKKRKKMRTC